MNILEQTTIRAPSGKDDICAKFIIDDIDTPFVFHDIVQNGEQYTLSFYIKAETSGSITASGAGMEVSAEWARHIVTFIADSADVQVYFNAIGTYCIYNAQLEIGCKATDFVIAPEDVDEDILAVSSRTAELEVGLAGIVSRVSTTETMLVGTESRLTTVETLATQTADKFNWLVKSGDNETNFTLTDHTATLIAQTISLNGDVKVNGAMIVDGSITASELAAGAVTADKVLAGAITTDKLAATSVTAAKIAASAITADKLAASAVTAAKIAASAVTASAIASSAITTDKLAASAVTAAKIASRTITADKIVAGAITANEIASATITANNIAANTITAASGVIADAAITNAKIASIDAAKITSGYISADRIAAGAITTEKLSTDAIKSTNYAYSSGNYSTAGTFLDLSTGLIRSKNFAIDSSGNTYLKGTIYATAGTIGGFSISSSQLYGLTSVTSGTASTQYGVILAKSSSQTGTAIAAGSRSYDGSSYGSWSYKTYIRNDGYFYSVSGKIGGFAINSSAIYNGTSSMTSTTAGVYVGTAGIRNYKDSNTYVDIKDGVITAKGASITGGIDATSLLVKDSLYFYNSSSSSASTAISGTGGTLYLGGDSEAQVGNGTINYGTFESTGSISEAGTLLSSKYATVKHTHSDYLPLSGGKITGSIKADVKQCGYYLMDSAGTSIT